MKPWVTFDMDNTLLKSPYWRLHFRPWLEEQAAHSSQDYHGLWSRFQQAGEQRWHHGDWVGSFDWTDIARSLSLDALPEPSTPSSHQVRTLILPGVEEMLRSLVKMNIHLGVVTNGFYRFQIPFLKALGWDYIFDAVIGPDVAGAAKPHPAIVSRLTPGIAHVGDRLSHDVLVAKRSRRAGVLIGNPGHEPDRIDPLSPVLITPDYAIQHFRELPSIIAHLLDIHSY